MLETEGVVKFPVRLKRLESHRRLAKNVGVVEEYLSQFGPDLPLTDADFKELGRLSVNRSISRRLRHNLEAPPRRTS